MRSIVPTPSYPLIALIILFAALASGCPIYSDQPPCAGFNGVCAEQDEPSPEETTCPKPEEDYGCDDCNPCTWDTWCDPDTYGDFPPPHCEGVETKSCQHGPADPHLACFPAIERDEAGDPQSGKCQGEVCIISPQPASSSPKTKERPRRCPSKIMENMPPECEDPN